MAKNSKENAPKVVRKTKGKKAKNKTAVKEKIKDFIDKV